jgi:periplasmic divalent cation tolerance protein
MSTIYAIAMTTTSSKAEAETIARALLAQHLAACIQVTQIQSYYTWKDSINVDNEQLLLIKCKQIDFAEIQQCIIANHSYEVPEIIQIPITAGLPGYLDWISAVTRSSGERGAGSGE